MRIYLAWIWWILTVTVRMPTIPPGEGNSANGGGGNTTVDHAADQSVKLVVLLAGPETGNRRRALARRGSALDRSPRACPPMVFLCPRKPLWPFPRVSGRLAAPRASEAGSRPPILPI